MNEEDVIYPPERSKEGTNAFYHFCDHIERNSNYAVCMNVLTKIEEGSLPETSFADCQREYAKGNCPAVAMRQEEIDADKSIYYLKRTLPKAEKRPLMSRSVAGSTNVDKKSASYLRGRYGADSKEYNYAMGRNVPSKPRPVPKAQKPKRPTNNGVIQMDMSKLVNEIAKEEAKPKTGESPLEFARRMRESS